MFQASKVKPENFCGVRPNRVFIELEFGNFMRDYAFDERMTEVVRSFSLSANKVGGEG